VPNSAKKRVIVVGAGLSGLACAVKLAEERISVDLFSMAPARQSHSVCEQGGINACNEIARQEGFSEWIHFDETILGGDFLADQPPVLEMCNWAPRIVDLLDRMGVPFHRTPEGRRALRLLGGSLFHRTFFAGATTGRHVLHAFDDQVRRREAEGLIRRFEYSEFLWPVIHNGHCVGIIAQDLRTMQIAAFRADAVVMATGGSGMIFGKSTMSVGCTGAAAARCYQAGANYGNPEFIQIHPTTIPGEDKCRVVSEAARGEGGRVWVPRKPADTRHPASIPEGERFYFLEERHPKFGNLVPRDIAARDIFQVCTEMKLGVDGGNLVYLDLADAVKRQGRETILTRLDGTLQIYKKFAGADPLKEPIKVFPAVHGTLGGLWVGFKKDEKTGGLKSGDPVNMMTSIPGLYAIGEVSFAHHGANGLGGNSLLSRIFDGLFGGTCIRNYCIDVAPTAAADVPQSAYDSAVNQENDRQRRLFSNHGDENPHLLWQEMGRAMTEHCTVIRDNDRLRQTLSRCQEWKRRYRQVKLADTGTWANQNLGFVRALSDMIVLAEATLQGALLRNESRGAHYKPGFPQRDDAGFLKATIVQYDAIHESPSVDYAPVDISLIPPRVREYGKKTAGA
jgi:succinate dehydrogenase / fumarate reductase flavoprotein subunit